MKKKMIFWAGYFVIVAFMLLLAFLWNDSWNDKLFDGARGYFLEQRAMYLRVVISCVIWEEAVWRLIPILTTSVLMICITNRWIKYLLGIICVSIILYIQVLFGEAHYSEPELNPVFGTSCASIANNVVIQGGSGVIFAFTYISVLFYMFKFFFKEKKTGIIDNLKRVLIANALGYASSMIIHAASNTLVVITQTY